MTAHPTSPRAFSGLFPKFPARNHAYKDERFRSYLTHYIDRLGTRHPAKGYSYESDYRLYDIIVFGDPQRVIYKISGRSTAPSAVHREINVFFQLGLEV